jgi:excisionase family DNA binding protein
MEPSSFQPVVSVDVLGAVAATGLGRTKIFEAINQGRLRARKAGRRTLIHIDDLNAFIRSLPVKEVEAA